MWHRGEVAKMIQVRNVRPELHAELVRRARQRGMTLTGYVEEILERETARDDPGEIWERIEERRTRRPSAVTTEEIVAAIREMRGPLPPG
jgi:hypothetical protein